MKAKKFNLAWPAAPKINSALLSLLLLIPLSLLFSCQKGDDPFPGLAFVAISYTVVEPEFIEMENPFIPELFYWDWFYRTDPGLYYIYYEGDRRVGGRSNPYAWEIEYEIWEYEGKRARYFWQEGETGPDAYFTIVCSPYGPEVHHEKDYPEKTTWDDDQIISAPGTEKEIIIEELSHNFGFRMRYRQVIPRSHTSGPAAE